MAETERPAKRMKLEEYTAASSAEEDDQLKRELRAGITHYVSPNTPGFCGILKQRYTDFLVNEIEPSGIVVHLNNTAVPIQIANMRSAAAQRAREEEKAEAEAVAKETAKLAEAAKAVNGEGDGENPATTITEEQQQQLDTLFGEPCTVAIIKLYHDVLKHPDRKPKDFRTVSTWSIDDKSARGTAHNAIRTIFHNRLTSSHSDKNQLVISKTARGGRGADGGKWSRNDAGSQGGGKRKLGWDELGGEYLHFTLCKENKDTMEVVSFLGTQLKCAPKHFAFAGTKDRRACTVQRVSVYRQHAWQLAGLNKILKQGSRVGDFEYKQFGLELGALWGNEFVITLRDCHFPGEEAQWTFQDQLALARKTVGDAVKNLQERGFMNYYGLQRFGSFSAGTDDIGMALLKSDFEAAVSLILSFHPDALTAAQAELEGKDPGTAKISSDDKNRALALHTWVTEKNGHKAADMMPRKFSTEAAIIRYLGMERHGKKVRDNDFVGAMQAIQRNMRLMYVHAYQSLVWNTVAGKRWELYGSRVVEGDLIIIGHKKDGAKFAEPEVDEDGEVIVRPAPEDTAASDGDFTRARPLSKEEAESGTYDIFDVVLPLPGWDVVYPKNAVGEFYRTFMGSEEGGGLDPLDMRRKWKDYSLSGGYRKLLNKPADGMSFEVKGYSDEAQQLVETDIERLAKADKASKNGVKPENGDVNMEGGEEKDDKYIAVVLKLKLGSSQYATMALRELLKQGGLKSFKADFSGRGY